jgi:hypothetical protein
MTPSVRLVEVTHSESTFSLNNVRAGLLQSRLPCDIQIRSHFSGMLADLSRLTGRRFPTARFRIRLAGRGNLRIMAVDEQEIPYHVRAITELAKNYSPAAFRVEIGHCRGVIGKVSAEDNRSDQQRARYLILRYLDLQLARSVDWVDKEADLMAWVMRNLIELKFWAKFVSESEERATQFVNESNIDLREVVERLERLRPADAEPMPPLPPNSDGKRVDVKRSGDQEELTWKTASKLIHPSSYVINGFEDTIRAESNSRLLKRRCRRRVPPLTGKNADVGVGADDRMIASFTGLEGVALSEMVDEICNGQQSGCEEKIARRTRRRKGTEHGISAPEHRRAPSLQEKIGTWGSQSVG